jgi:3-hydroxyisobutyrate dehydrogenase
MALRAGFVGLGQIGRRMALRLPRAGLETIVFDIAPPPVQDLVAAGAKAAGSPREVAAASDVVGIAVNNDAQVRAVVEGENGLLAGARPGLVILVHSTVLPSTVEAVAAAAKGRGVELVDACVTGTTTADDAVFKLFVGGEPALLDRVSPYTSAIAARVIPTGGLGNSCKAKICLNLITYTQWLATFESFSLAKATGLPIEVWEEIGRSNGQITEMMVNYSRGLRLPEEARRSQPVQKLMRGFMNVAEKDLAWVLQLARDGGVALPGAALVSQLMARIYGVEDAGRR